jgi:DNA-binding NarL/FixJ family response regulator
VRQRLSERSAPALTGQEALVWLSQHGLDACDLDESTPLELALSCLPAAQRSATPVAVAVDAALKRLQGRTRESLALFQRALALHPDRAVAIQIHEHRIALLMAISERRLAREALDLAIAIAHDDVRLKALDLELRANARSATVEEVSVFADCLEPIPTLWHARIYLRLGSAAYVLGQFAVAETCVRRALDAAESVRASRLAAIAYHNLATLYGAHVGDVSRTLKYVELGLKSADKSGDEALRFPLRCFAYAFAAETGNGDLLERLRKPLGASRSLDTDAKHFFPLLGDAMYYGLRSDWHAMQQYLESIDSDSMAQPQRALMCAFHAVALCGNGNLQEALRFAYMALYQSRPRLRERSSDTRLKLIGRLMASAVLVKAQYKCVAARKLHAYSTRMSSQMHSLAEAILTASCDTIQGCEALKGYAMLLAGLMKQATPYESTVVLTRRQLEVLHGFIAGKTARSIAADLHLAQVTVEGHAVNIRRKLGVRRMVGAIARARDIGLMP